MCVGAKWYVKDIVRLYGPLLGTIEHLTEGGDASHTQRKADDHQHQDSEPKLTKEKSKTFKM